jgi:hypothetical protein
VSPIIEAIDAGHINHGNKCVACSTESNKVPYPCDVVEGARVANRAYVEALQAKRQPLISDALLRA